MISLWKYIMTIEGEMLIQLFLTGSKNHPAQDVYISRPVQDRWWPFHPFTISVRLLRSRMLLYRESMAAPKLPREFAGSRRPFWKMSPDHRSLFKIDAFPCLVMMSILCLQMVLGHLQTQWWPSLGLVYTGPALDSLKHWGRVTHICANKTYQHWFR